MGVSRRDERQRHCVGTQAYLRCVAEEISQHADSHFRPVRGTAGRANGQQRGWPPQHRRGPHRAHGHHADRSTDCQQSIAKCPAISASDGVRPAAPVALDGAAERWRGALPYQPSFRVAGNGQATKSGKRFCALLPGWARHAAAQRPRLRAPIAAEDARAGRGTDRHAGGPLLRDGPRQSLGAHGACLPRRSARRGGNAHGRSHRGDATELRWDQFATKTRSSSSISARTARAR